MQAHTTLYSKDVKFFLVLIPCINVLNYYLTYTHVSFSWFTAVTFIIDTLEGYGAWLAIRAIIRYLDKNRSLASYPLRRIALQIMLTSVAGLAVIVASTELVNYLAAGKPIPLDFYTKTIFLFLIWIFVVNGIYIGWNYYIRWQQVEQAHRQQQRAIEQEKQAKREGFMVKLGKQNLVLAFADIEGFWVENNYTFVRAAGNQKHILDQSLDKIENILPADGFFRINRQLIVHRQLIAGYKRIENGKLLVTFQPHVDFPPSAQISRLKAAEFKQWVQDGLSDFPLPDDVTEPLDRTS